MSSRSDPLPVHRCRYCRQVPVSELDNACPDCRRRIDHPAPGDGCAVNIGSDTYPATVVRVTTHTIVVHWDKVHGGGLTTPCGGTREMRFVKNARGEWVHRSYHLSLGARDHRLDPEY